MNFKELYKQYNTKTDIFNKSFELCNAKRSKLAPEDKLAEQHNMEVILGELKRDAYEFNLKSTFLDSAKVFAAFKSALPKDMTAQFDKDTQTITVVFDNTTLDFNPFGMKDILSTYADHDCGNYVFISVDKKPKAPLECDIKTTADKVIDDELMSLGVNGDDTVLNKMYAVRGAMIDTTLGFISGIQMSKQPKLGSLTEEFRKITTQKELF